MSMTIKRKPEEDKIRAKLIEECVRRAKARKARSPAKDSSVKKDKLKASKPAGVEKKVQVELVAKKKRKMVDLGAHSTVKQIIDTFGKRVIGDGCIIMYDGVKLDEKTRLEELPGSAPYRLVLDKEE